ncbi:unnamed protein product [Gongylonema pulchrum]|uniref:MIT_C domain-containing protein n=1 Tax=Gongylonema pulchrum TaxID=637853 RepID=A0A183ERH9_9BILA|nr:unnamed protein product [Gongylonema pulchrum]
MEKAVNDYLGRAELIKKKVPRVPVLDQQIHISHGQEYGVICLIQVQNFMMFCEFFIEKAPNLRKIRLRTRYNSEAEEHLKQLQLSMEKFGVELVVQFDDDLHDREFRHVTFKCAVQSQAEGVSTFDLIDPFTARSSTDLYIMFDNGWLVKIGRGLSYFQKTESFSIGKFNTNLRKCLETSVDIFRMELQR